MSDPTPLPDAAAPASPAPAAQSAPQTPSRDNRDSRDTARTVRRAIGWCVVAAIGLLAALSLAPDLLGGLSDDLRLSTRHPFAQAIAIRSGIVLILVLVGLVIAASALTHVLRREGGLRTGALALVLLLVAGAHTWVLWDRGLQTAELPAAASDEAWDGGLTVLTFNTYAGRANTVELAIAIRTAAPDVVVLPETHAGDTAELLTLLTQDGLAYTAYTSYVQPAQLPGTSAQEGADAAADAATDTASAEPTSEPTGFTGDPSATSVLVSAAVGEYEQVKAPDGLGHGAVLLQPVGDTMLNGHQRPTILGVHTIAPLKDTMDLWEGSVRHAVAQCQGPATGLVLAGDFNATLDHAPMKDLGGCTDAALQAGAGGLSTWPASTHTPLLGAPIDHVLVDTATWTSTGADLIEVTGSDHRGLLVTLEQR